MKTVFFSTIKTLKFNKKHAFESLLALQVHRILTIQLTWSSDVSCTPHAVCVSSVMQLDSFSKKLLFAFCRKLLPHLLLFQIFLSLQFLSMLKLSIILFPPWYTHLSTSKQSKAKHPPKRYSFNEKLNRGSLSLTPREINIVILMCLMSLLER